jgi:TPR repeat protein
MVRRARALIETGDIAGARLFLERALEAADGEAALLLGSTYDPRWLAEQGVQGLAGDPTRARRLYEKARDLGAADASAKLRLLDQPGP